MSICFLSSSLSLSLALPLHLYLSIPLSLYIKLVMTHVLIPFLILDHILLSATPLLFVSFQFFFFLSCLP